MMDKNEKKEKQAKKVRKEILKILVPEQVKRSNENSGWCGTVSAKPDAGKLKKQYDIGC